jgi:hypothetical protein
MRSMVENATVRMPHLGDEAHLWRVQRKVLRERQSGLEDSSLAETRGILGLNEPQGDDNPH